MHHGTHSDASLPALTFATDPSGLPEAARPALLELAHGDTLELRVAEDGKFITSAGVSAGSDMALALVARLTGEPTTRLVQLWIEHDPQPPFGGIDWDRVDRHMAEPQVTQWVRTQLADRPDLLAA